MSEIPLPALLTTFGELEFINALRLGVFRKKLNNTQARAVYAAMRDDIRATVIAVHPVTDEMYAQSRRMATRWTPRLGVRSLDIIHVAAALELGADSFETFDKRQKQLAEPIGLRVR